MELETKMENGPKQPRGPSEKTNAGTLLDYYKPKGVDPRSTQPPSREGDKVDGEIDSESDRGSHLNRTPDGSIICIIEEKNTESAPPKET